MGTMGEVTADFSQVHGSEEEWMEQQSSARLFERSRIKVLAGTKKTFAIQQLDRLSYIFLNMTFTSSYL